MSPIPDTTVLPHKDPDPEQRFRETRACAALYAPSVKYHAEFPAVSRCVPQIDQSRLVKLTQNFKPPTPSPRFESLLDIDLYFAACNVHSTSASQKWLLDTELSKQVLRGVDLMLLTAVRQPQIATTVMENDDVLSGLLDGHESVCEAMEAQRLYCVHFRGLSETLRARCCLTAASVRNVVLDAVFSIFT